MHRVLILLLTYHLLPFKQDCKGSTLKEMVNNFKNKANQLKTNIKGIVEKYDGDQLDFTPNSEIDYPHGDKNKLKKIHNLWEEYYNCQRLQLGIMGLKRRIIPTAVVALLGGYLNLKCEICTSPRDIDQESEWYFSDSINISEAQILLMDEFILADPHDLSLQIFNIQLHQAGLYICKQGNNTSYPYIVHVLCNETFTEVHPDSALDPHSMSSTTIRKLHVTLSSQWTEWSECSECGQVGRRTRLGICSVDFNEDVDEVNEANSISTPFYKRSKKDNEDINISKTMNSKEIRETLPNIYEIFEIFEDGIPCRSKLLPKFLANAWEIKSRPSEIMVGFCKVPCPENTIFIVSDEKGNIIDAVNNSAGEYSYYQGKPTVLHVERVAVFAEYKTTVIITCPGSNKKNTPTEWFTGKTPLVNKLLKQQSYNRISINKHNNLIIKEVLFSDARVYSCWQWKELVGTVRLYVNKTRKIEVNYPITVVGASLIIFTFGIIYLKVFINKVKL